MNATGWVYERTEPRLWTVGFYDPRGEWHTDSDHAYPQQAAARVRELNGGAPIADDELRPQGGPDPVKVANAVLDDLNRAAHRGPTVRVVGTREVREAVANLRACLAMIERQRGEIR